MKIEIDIEDDRLFTDVALIVDRKDFSDEVERLRKVFGINFTHGEKGNFKAVSKSLDEKIEREIETSRKHLYLPVVFRTVIETVVFRNRVTKADYSPAYLDCIQNGTFDKEGATPDDTYIIVLSPGARDEDVIKAYQQYRDQLGNIKGVPRYQYIHQVWDIEIAKPAIRKHRKWYHAWTSGSTYVQICDAEADECPIKNKHNTGKSKSKECSHYDEGTIKRGIERYEALVLQTRTF